MKSGFEIIVPLKDESIHYECDKCKLNFPQKDELETHFTTVHKNKKHDIILHQSFLELSKLEGSDEKGLQENLECLECESLFTTKLDLKRHIKTNHLTLKLFKCNLCEASFADNEILLSHLKNRHHKRKGLLPAAAAAAGVVGLMMGSHESNNNNNHGLPPLASAMSRALKPQFSCGACPAKFFKNSFLIKHCESHEKLR